MNAKQKHTKNSLGTSSFDDDLGANRGNPNLNTGVTIFSEYTAQKLVHFSVQNSISNNLRHKTQQILNNENAA